MSASRAPVISVIVPVYNRAHLIARPINSLLTQTFLDFEVLVVDDGSKDDLATALKAFPDERIRLLTHPVNRGVNAARNTGLAHATGAWVTFLDSDDELVPRALQQALHTAQTTQDEVDIVIANCRDSQTGLPTASGPDHGGRLSLRELLTAQEGETWRLIRREVFEQARFPQSLPGYESVLWLPLAEKVRAVYLDEPLRIYHTDSPDALTKNRPGRKKRQAVSLGLLGYPEYLRMLEQHFPRRYHRVCKHGLRRTALAGEAGPAREYLHRLLQTRPGWTQALRARCMFAGGLMLGCLHKFARKSDTSGED